MQGQNPFSFLSTFVLVVKFNFTSVDSVAIKARDMLRESPNAFDQLRRSLKYVMLPQKKVSILEELVSFRPKDIDLRGMLISIYALSLHDYDSAEPHAKELNALAPNLAWVHSHLADTYAHRGTNPELVESYYKRAIEIEPKSFAHHWNLATFLSEQKRTAEAVTEARTALACPDLPPKLQKRLNTQFENLKKQLLQ